MYIDQAPAEENRRGLNELYCYAPIKSILPLPGGDPGLAADVVPNVKLFLILFLSGKRISGSSRSAA